MSLGQASIGIDVGGTKCAAVAYEPSRGILARTRRPAPRDADALLGTFDALIADLRAGSDVPITALGIGVPGLVTAAGVLRYAPHLDGVRELDLAAEAQARYGLPVSVENDNTAAAWAEAASGAAEGSRHVLYVGFGTGIGGASVVDGHVQRGHQGFAGEIGHMVVQPEGMACVCGRRGCWERYASGSALADLARARFAATAPQRRPPWMVDVGAPLRGEQVSDAARGGDGDALAVVGALAGWIALGLANLVLAGDPEVIVVGGGLFEGGGAEPLLGLVRAALPGCFGEDRHHRALPEVRAAAWGADSAAVGAALLARAGPLRPER